MWPRYTTRDFFAFDSRTKLRCDSNSSFLLVRFVLPSAGPLLFTRLGAVAFAPETQGDFPGFPTTTTTTTPSQPRKKVPYEKGYSQQDWLRLTRSSTEDLTGNGGRPLGRKISLSEVAQHRTEDDAWMVLNGKVYNVTRYVKFHPGGVDYLMQGAGKDATRLFNKYHKWVNADFMLQKCFLGQVVK